MAKVLVFGGTRFFGKKLVEKLIHNGHDVTIATRGNTADSFGEQVKRIQLDRGVNDSRWDSISNIQWDAIYDNICYGPEQAKIAIKRLGQNASKYIFTSTLSVYDTSETPLDEEDFSPYHYDLNATCEDLD
ncbi:NAD-dependent epimerase/dehydratase family protein [Peribacillus sp. SCS-155]|uniref:NAD-dependent epimerase/dehydratase family protein n=1 Tax=Peribacillus sedimenti TaxID=3115297 RepID=UPI00390581B8